MTRLRHEEAESNPQAALHHPSCETLPTGIGQCASAVAAAAAKGGVHLGVAIDGDEAQPDAVLQLGAADGRQLLRQVVVKPQLGLRPRRDRSLQSPSPRRHWRPRWLGCMHRSPQPVCSRSPGRRSLRVGFCSHDGVERLKFGKAQGGAADQASAARHKTAFFRPGSRGPGGPSAADAQLKGAPRAWRRT